MSENVRLSLNALIFAVSMLFLTASSTNCQNDVPSDVKADPSTWWKALSYQTPPAAADEEILVYGNQSSIIMAAAAGIGSDSAAAAAAAAVRARSRTVREVQTLASGCRRLADLQLPDNVLGRVRNRGAMILYRCVDRKFILYGSATSVCINREWSHPPPFCVAPGCRRLALRPTSPLKPTYKTQYLSAVVTFSCIAGYQFVETDDADQIIYSQLATDTSDETAPPMMYCNGTTWKGLLPRCQRIPATTAAVAFTTERSGSTESETTQLEFDSFSSSASPDGDATIVTASQQFYHTTDTIEPMSPTSTGIADVSHATQTAADEETTTKESSSTPALVTSQLTNGDVISETTLCPEISSAVQLSTSLVNSFGSTAIGPNDDTTELTQSLTTLSHATEDRTSESLKLSTSDGADETTEISTNKPPVETTVSDSGTTMNYTTTDGHERDTVGDTTSSPEPFTTVGSTSLDTTNDVIVTSLSPGYIGDVTSFAFTSSSSSLPSSAGNLELSESTASDSEAWTTSQRVVNTNDVTTANRVLFVGNETSVTPTTMTSVMTTLSISSNPSSVSSATNTTEAALTSTVRFNTTEIISRGSTIGTSSSLPDTSTTTGATTAATTTKVTTTVSSTTDIVSSSKSHVSQQASSQTTISVHDRTMHTGPKLAFDATTTTPVTSSTPPIRPSTLSTQESTIYATRGESPVGGQSRSQFTSVRQTTQTLFRTTPTPPKTKTTMFLTTQWRQQWRIRSTSTTTAAVDRYSSSRTSAKSTWRIQTITTTTATVAASSSSSAVWSTSLATTLPVQRSVVYESPEPHKVTTAVPDNSEENTSRREQSRAQSASTVDISAAMASLGGILAVFGIVVAVVCVIRRRATNKETEVATAVSGYEQFRMDDSSGTASNGGSSVVWKVVSGLCRTSPEVQDDSYSATPYAPMATLSDATPPLSRGSLGSGVQLDTLADCKFGCSYDNQNDDNGGDVENVVVMDSNVDDNDDNTSFSKYYELETDM